MYGVLDLAYQIYPGRARQICVLRGRQEIGS